MNRRLSVYPGIDFNFSQPISDNVEEAVSGVKGAIVAKVYGKDLAESEKLAWQVYHTMKPIAGITDLGVIRNMGQPELQIDIDEDRLARYGVKKRRRTEHHRDGHRRKSRLAGLRGRA